MSSLICFEWHQAQIQHCFVFFFKMAPLAPWPVPILYMKHLWTAPPRLQKASSWSLAGFWGGLALTTGFFQLVRVHLDSSGWAPERHGRRRRCVAVEGATAVGGKRAQRGLRGGPWPLVSRPFPPRVEVNAAARSRDARRGFSRQMGWFVGFARVTTIYKN